MCRNPTPLTGRSWGQGWISRGLVCVGMVPRFQRLPDTGGRSSFSNLIFCCTPLALDPHHHLCQNHPRLLGRLDPLLDIRANAENSYVYTIVGATLVAQLVKNLPAMQETWVQSLGWEDPLEEGMATHSSTLAGESPWREEPGSPQGHRVGHN